MISLIFAHDINYGIGKGGKLPWPLLREDLKQFQLLTNSGINLITRKTLDSIPENKLGQKLPGRNLVVITSDTKYRCKYSNAIVFNDLDSAIDYCINTYPDIPLNILGGSSIYEQVFPIANIIYSTSILSTFDGCDTFLPNNVIDYISRHEPDVVNNVFFKDIGLHGLFKEYYLGDL